MWEKGKKGEFEKKRGQRAPDGVFMLHFPKRF